MDKAFYESLIKEATESGINRYVVGAVIQRDSSVLLLERPRDDFMGGIYELPSGKVEYREALDAALYREVKEETGLEIRGIRKYLGHFDYESRSGKKTRQFNFVVDVGEPLDIRLQEHDNYVWADKDQLNRYSATDSVKSLLSSFFKSD